MQILSHILNMFYSNKLHQKLFGCQLGLTADPQEEINADFGSLHLRRFDWGEVLIIWFLVFEAKYLSLRMMGQN